MVEAWRELRDRAPKATAPSLRHIQDPVLEKRVVLVNGQKMITLGVCLSFFVAQIHGLLSLSLQGTTSWNGMRPSCCTWPPSSAIQSTRQRRNGDSGNRTCCCRWSSKQKQAYVCRCTPIHGFLLPNTSRLLQTFATFGGTPHLTHMDPTCFCRRRTWKGHGESFHRQLCHHIGGLGSTTSQCGGGIWTTRSRRKAPKRIQHNYIFSLRSRFWQSREMSSLFFWWIDNDVNISNWHILYVMFFDMSFMIFSSFVWQATRPGTANVSESPGDKTMGLDGFSCMVCWCESFFLTCWISLDVCSLSLVFLNIIFILYIFSFLSSSYGFRDDSSSCRWLALWVDHILLTSCQEIKNLEDTLLHDLAASKGSILDNDDLIHTLNTAKAGSAPKNVMRNHDPWFVEIQKLRASFTVSTSTLLVVSCASSQGNLHSDWRVSGDSRQDGWGSHYIFFMCNFLRSSLTHHWANPALNNLNGCWTRCRVSLSLQEIEKTRALYVSAAWLPNTFVFFELVASLQPIQVAKRGSILYFAMSGMVAISAAILASAQLFSLFPLLSLIFERARKCTSTRWVATLGFSIQPFEMQSQTRLLTTDWRAAVAQR